MSGIRPWCVGRQLWGGHQLPVWYRFCVTSGGRHTRFDCDWSSDVCSSDLHGELTPRLSAVRALDHERDVEALVVHVGEGMTGVDGERRQDRIDAGAEQGVNVAPLGVVQIGRASCRERV